jgi:hypothetical protein
VAIVGSLKVPLRASPSEGRPMIKRPSLAATVWFLAFATVSILLLRQAPWAVPDKQPGMIFGIKVFYDSAKTTGDRFVSIRGTITGDGIGYKYNTSSIFCDKGLMECLVYSIEQIGPNLLGSLDGPMSYPIIKWDAYEIIATSGDNDCRKVTISLERKTETALWVEEPINQTRVACKNSENKIYKYTIEDPPFWKALRDKKSIP